MPPRVLVFLALFWLTSAFDFAGSRSQKDSWSSNSAQSNSKSTPDDCLSITEAHKHIGKTQCVTGTVVRVEEGHNGVTFLDFCPDYHKCPFAVIVFAGDLRRIGDVRQLQGRLVAIKGRIEEYDDRAEIVLTRPQQLGEAAAILTALPKDYDVERQGHYSAGSARLPKAAKTKHVRQGPPVPLEDPEEP